MSEPIFISRAGVPTQPLTDVELHDIMIGFAEKRLDKPGLAAVFRRQLAH